MLSVIFVLIGRSAFEVRFPRPQVTLKCFATCVPSFCSGVGHHEYGSVQATGISYRGPLCAFPTGYTTFIITTQQHSFSSTCLIRTPEMSFPPANGRQKHCKRLVSRPAFLVQGRLGHLLISVFEGSSAFHNDGEAGPQTSVSRKFWSCACLPAPSAQQ